MGKTINLSGQRFGKLTAYSYAHVQLSTGRRMAAWLCICDCGNKKVIQGHHLRGGKSQSCGCYIAECTIERNTVHGLSKTPRYLVWKAMINRCHRPDVAEYKSYGARGIRVCDRWRFGENGKHGFVCYIEDTGDEPAPDYSIDRIDNDGNYEPGNCRWATRAQQAANMRRSIHAVIGGVKVPLVKYAARLGFSYESLRIKVSKKGMSVTEAARDIRGYWRVHRRAA